MIPTARAAATLVVIGFVALILPPWLSVALFLVLVAATAADAWSVRRSPAIDRAVPDVLSRGVPVELTVRARPDGRRVILRQPPGPELQVADAEGTASLAASVIATKRGLQTLPGVASASIGPLGLARVHHTPTAPLIMRVLPDVAGARRLIMRLRRTRAGITGGRARGPLGLGTEFESVREYTIDDDVRTLNWRASARLGHPMSNQYRVERDRDVVCVIDCGRLMAAPLGDGSTVLDLALDAMTVIALAADELGDRFGAVVFDDAVRRVLTPRHRGGGAAVRSLFDLESRPVDSDFESALIHVSRLRRAVVFVFTDLLDEAAARSLATGVLVLARRHAAYVVSPADPSVELLTADESAPARALAALQVLSARRLAALQLRQAGARVLEAAPERLATSCLDAYLMAKLRARI
jgi:uncharacterized protein (DUF58 family)